MFLADISKKFTFFMKNLYFLQITTIYIKKNNKIKKILFND